MTLGERGLAHHPLLADDDEEDDDDLTGVSMVSHDLIPTDEMVVHEETVKNGREGGMNQRLSHKLPVSPCHAYILIASLLAIHAVNRDIG